MNIDKDQLARILIDLIESLPAASEAESEPTDDDIATIKRNFLGGMAGVLSQISWHERFVFCSMPNNGEVIHERLSVKCEICGSYFCLRHNLAACPKCHGVL